MSNAPTDKQEDNDDGKGLNQSAILLKLTDVLKIVGESNQQVLSMARADERVRKVKIIMLFLPIAIILIFYLGQKVLSKPFDGESYVSLVEINGEISTTNIAANAKTVIAGLQKAFMDERSRGVFISIDSPGGSPAESARIHDEIKALKEQYPDKKVIAFGNGHMTSGAYWIACAADEIHALSMTMVGSIGVKMETYNFSEIAKKYQVSKHVFTAGENKVRLDPFIPPREVDVEKFNIMLTKLHTLFKETVLASREDKLTKTASYDEVFSGDFWLGIEAVDLGLIDSVSTPNKLLMQEFGTVHMLDYTTHPNMLETLNRQRVFGSIDDLVGIKIR